jgi:hypothetical protein
MYVCVCVCVCVCVYMYIYTHTHIYIYIRSTYTIEYYKYTNVCSYRLLNAVVAQSKNRPFGVNTTSEPKNTATSDSNVI